MRSFRIQVDDSQHFGIEESFSIFAQDIIEAAIKSHEFMDALQEQFRLQNEKDKTFPAQLDSLRVAWISDEGELVGGNTSPNSGWATEFAGKLMEKIKSDLDGALENE